MYPNFTHGHIIYQHRLVAHIRKEVFYIYSIWFILKWFGILIYIYIYKAYP